MPVPKDKKEEEKPYMKRILTIFTLFASLVMLAACNTKVRNTAPELRGVVKSHKVSVGDTFNPLAGITAYDKEDGDITSAITSTFDPAWLNTAGSYTFSVEVLDSKGEKAKETVTLVVGRVSAIRIIAPDALTYYIGSKPFDPLEEVRAYDELTGKPVEVTVTDEDYVTNIASRGTYTVTAEDETGAKVVKTISLTVKEKEFNIPDAIPKGELIEITLWHSNGSTIETAIQGYAADFVALMATQGYTVKINIVKNGSNYDELRTNVVNALKGGELPNIVQNYPDHVVEYHANNAIISLAPYIHHPIHGYNENDPKEAFTGIIENYREEQRRTNLSGDYLSLPFNKSTEVVVYNKDVFDQVLAGKPFPKTWQDLFALAPDLVAMKDQIVADITQRWQAAGTPLTADEQQVIKDKFTPFTYDSSANAFITLTRQFGGTYTSRKADGKGSLDFQNDITKEMLTFFGENRDIFTVPGKWDANYASDVFKKGNTLVAIGSTAGVRYNTPTEKGTKIFNVGVAPMLYDKDSPASRAVIQQGTNMSLTTSGTDVQKLVSWYFLKYLTSHAVQRNFGIITGYSPIRTSVYTDPLYEEYLANADIEILNSNVEMGLSQTEFVNLYQLKVKAMANKVAMEQTQYQYFDIPFIGSSKTREAVGIAFDRVILAAPGANLETEIKNALQYAIDEANKVVK